MKQLLENIKQELIAQCKTCIEEERKIYERYFKTRYKFCVKHTALYHFNQSFQCFTDLFDTEEEVLQWLEDEKMIWLLSQRDQLLSLPQFHPLSEVGPVSAEEKALVNKLDEKAVLNEEIPWIEWNGGECPLKDDEVEEWEYTCRSGYANSDFGFPSSRRWTHLHNKSSSDIIAYRVLKWKEKPGLQDPYAELKKAHAEGKVIQVKRADGSYLDTSSSPLAVGDLVMLKSEGPKMTVVDHADHSMNNGCWCAWFDGNKFNKGFFQAACLKKAI